MSHRVTCWSFIAALAVSLAFVSVGAACYTRFGIRSLNVQPPARDSGDAEPKRSGARTRRERRPLPSAPASPAPSLETFYGSRLRGVFPNPLVVCGEGREARPPARIELRQSESAGGASGIIEPVRGRALLVLSELDADSVVGYSETVL